MAERSHDAGVGADNDESPLFPEGPDKVKKVARQFLVKGDEGLAYRLQNEEYGVKYEWNRNDRQTARQDVPLAKLATSEEEERQQRECMEQIQRQRQLSEDDAQLAREFQKEELLIKEHARIRRELQDQELARQIQERESQRLAILSEQELRRAAQPEQLLILSEAEGRMLESSSGQSRPASNGSSSHVRLVEFAGFQVPPDDVMSEDEQRELLRLQDEELARAIQEQEQMRALRSKRSATAREIEMRDAHLARIMQETERLNALRLRERPAENQPVQRHMSAVGTTTNTQTTGVQLSRSVSEPEGRSPSILPGRTANRQLPDMAEQQETPYLVPRRETSTREVTTVTTRSEFYMNGDNDINAQRLNNAVDRGRPVHYEGETAEPTRNSKRNSAKKASCKQQ